MRNKKETASKVKRQQLIEAQLLYAQYHFKRSQIESLIHNGVSSGLSR